MRVGLNLLYLIPGVVGGTEIYARGLIDGLKSIKTGHEYFLFVNQESAGLILDSEPNFTKVICPVHAANRKHRYFFEQVKLGSYINEYRIDLLHSLAYTAPLFSACPAVVTIPDLNFKAFGSSMPWSRRLMLELIVRQAVLHSDAVITISEFSRQEILSHYHVPPEKMKVTYLAADFDPLETEGDDEADSTNDASFIGNPYAVAFSSVTANKNLSRLIEAFMEARQTYSPASKLVFIGHRHPMAKAGNSREAEEDIIWTGYLKRRKVLKILSGADFLVFPSFYEGFGLPLLEAMAAGVPVVCSDCASLPEVAGDAGVYFDPYSVKDMAAKIAQVGADPKLKAIMREKGFKNIERFSWRKTAEDTVAVYERILPQVQAGVFKTMQRCGIES